MISERTVAQKERRGPPNCNRATTAPWPGCGPVALQVLVFCRSDDDERTGGRQRGEARSSFHHVASVEGELLRQRAVGGQVHGRIDGKADGVASLHEELSRVARDGKRRG